MFQYPSNRVVDRSTATATTPVSVPASFSTLQIGSLIEAYSTRRVTFAHPRFSTLQIGSLIEALVSGAVTTDNVKFQYPSNRVVDRSRTIPGSPTHPPRVSVPFKSGR